MLDADVTITRQLEDARFNRDGTSTAILRVEFLVGTHGPFIEKFEKASYTALARDQKLNEFAREVRSS